MENEPRSCKWCENFVQVEDYPSDILECEAFPKLSDERYEKVQDFLEVNGWKVREMPDLCLSYERMKPSQWLKDNPHLELNGKWKKRLSVDK